MSLSLQRRRCRGAPQHHRSRCGHRAGSKIRAGCQADRTSAVEPWLDRGNLNRHVASRQTIAIARSTTLSATSRHAENPTRSRFVAQSFLSWAGSDSHHHQQSGTGPPNPTLTCDGLRAAVQAWLLPPRGSAVRTALRPRRRRAWPRAGSRDDGLLWTPADPSI